ncbi:MatE family protein [Tritrichomonas foetus]|uniref:MatE family protein n=1 Tax=Tritrichomonas foetus TaxID=1144522 RepID=A0A1J4JV75_9EUKA|nr:MatE family protein [Tritrichomonas foetus]|eukprot:OHT01157.1 MatE family protein [Tritrichomonas foetus]
MEDADIEIESDYEESTQAVIMHEPLTRPKPGVSNYRLGGRKPLATIGSLMIGPVMLQVCGALYGVISTMWVSRALGTIGVSAISTYSTFDMIGRAFGFFLAVSASTKVSQLFGKGQHEEAGQVICDLLRMCLVCGAFVPAVLIPLVNICCRWFGASEEVVKMGFEYLCPILACSVFTCIYVTCNGLLQGEGRTLLVGIISTCSLVASMFGFETLFLFGFKSGIRGAGWATVLGDAIPGIGIAICYFTGKFTVKPNWRGLFKKFSPHSFPAMKVGISQLVSNLSMSIPGIVMRKLIGASVDSEADFNNALAGYNMVFRYAMITNCVVIAVSMGFIPAASYAYAAKLYKRFLRLFYHGLWIAGAWSVLTTIFSWAIPTEISKVFGSGDEYLKWAGPMLKYGNALGFIMFFRINAQGCLQALQLGGQAMILTITSQLIAIIAFAFILYYTDKHNAIRLCWAYPLGYAFGLVMGILVLIKPLMKVYRLYKETDGDNQPDVELQIEKSLKDIEDDPTNAKVEVDEEKKESESKSSSTSTTGSVMASTDKECENIVEI